MDAMTQALPLPDLIARVDTLEQRICGGPVQERVIAPAQLTAALRQVGRSYLEAAQQVGVDTAPRLELTDALRAVLDTQSDSGGHRNTMSLHQGALVQTVELVFRYLEDSADLDPLAYAALQHLQVVLAQALLSDPLTLESGRTVRQLCEQLVQVARGYDRQAGARADELLARLSGLVSETLSTAGTPEQSCAAALDKLHGLLTLHDRDSMRLARELVVKEQGLARNSDSRLVVSREILQAVQGRRLPRVLLEFLQRIWSKYLYVTYLRRGMDSHEWRRGVQDIQVLVDSFTINDPDDLLAFYAEHLSRALARVRLQSASIHGDRELTERFFTLMDEVPMRIMGGNPPAPEEALVTASPNPAADPGINLSREDRELLVGLRVGRWYHLQERDLKLRCRLVEHSTQFSYCLFTNLSSIKTARLDLRTVAQRLREGRLQPVVTDPPVEPALVFAVRELSGQLPTLEVEAEAAERERAALSERQRQQETAERLRRRHQEQLEAQARLLEERRREQHQRLRHRTQVREQAEHSAREQAWQQALNEVGRMQTGGMLQTLAADGSRIHCRLGLKIKSNGKLIFVDRLGRKVLELLPDELATHLVTGSAAITDYGVAFDDSLGMLINEHSERIHIDEDR
jgi:hypothetical protein